MQQYPIPITILFPLPWQESTSSSLPIKCTPLPSPQASHSTHLKQVTGRRWETLRPTSGLNTDVWAKLHCHGNGKSIQPIIIDTQEHTSHTPTNTQHPGTRELRTHAPPHVRCLGKRGLLDHFGSHPGVSPSRRHPRGLGHLPRQAEVRDLQRLVLELVVVDALAQQHCKKGKNQRLYLADDVLNPLTHSSNKRKKENEVKVSS